MDQLFAILGIAVGGYAAYGLVTGEVFAKSGVWGRTFRRDEDRVGYWSAIGAYTVLSILLLFFF